MCSRCKLFITEKSLLREVCQNNVAKIPTGNKTFWSKPLRLKLFFFSFNKNRISCGQAPKEGGRRNFHRGRIFFRSTREAKAKTLFCMVVVVSLLGGYTNESNMPRSFLRLLTCLTLWLGIAHQNEMRTGKEGKNCFILSRPIVF